MTIRKNKSDWSMQFMLPTDSFAWSLCVNSSLGMPLHFVETRGRNLNVLENRKLQT